MKKILLLAVVVALVGFFLWSPGNNTEVSDSLPIAIDVRLVADDKEFDATMTQGSNVLDLMENLRDTQGFEFTGDDHPDFGFFVQTVNGVEPSDNRYWIYYINDEKAQAGVSTYILEDEDVIKWALEESTL